MHNAWTRRRFAATLLGGGLASTNVLSADENKPATSDSPSKSPDPGTPKVPTHPAVEPQLALEDLLVLAVLQKYPPQELNAERLRGIRGGIARHLRSGELLRAGLQNGDEPATVFHARRFG